MEKNLKNFDIISKLIILKKIGFDFVAYFHHFSSDVEKNEFFYFINFVRQNESAHLSPDRNRARVFVVFSTTSDFKLGFSNEVMQTFEARTFSWKS